MREPCRNRFFLVTGPYFIIFSFSRYLLGPEGFDILRIVELSTFAVSALRQKSVLVYCFHFEFLIVIPLPH